MNKKQMHNGTMTTEGFFPYVVIRGIAMPVALEVDALKITKMQPPKRGADGRALYVAPDGTMESL